jgi:hypothetical protein
MKRLLQGFFLAALIALLATSAQAGSYVKESASLFLDGKVHIRFDQLMIAWTRDQKIIDRLKYKITCLAGKAVLVNVEYLDKAAGNQDSVRWAESASGLNIDFSAKLHHLDRQHRISISKTNHPQIAPYDMNSALVRFLVQASGRIFKIIWAPKTGQIYSTW